MDFSYTPPTASFDHGKVKGVVWKLIRLNDEQMEYACALGTCAESKLHYVVVADDRTGAELLKNGKLTRKVTMIPLNQIVVPRIAPDVCSLHR